MLRHEDLWRAVDRLAERYGLSPSGLARRAGLDATTFNKSKRVTREGKDRWPSCETIARILDATGASLVEFVALIDGPRGKGARRIPSIPLSAAESESVFDEAGHPKGAAWSDIDAPEFADTNVFALRVSDNRLEPLNRSGDLLIVSPSASAKPGDRVVLRTREGALLVGHLKQQDPRTIEIALSKQPPLRLNSGDVAWLARVLWTSQ